MNARCLASHSLALGPGGVVVVTGRSDDAPGAATAYDYLTVKYVESATITRLPAAGGYHLQFPSNPGQPYTVQRAEVLAGPWTDLFPGIVPGTGYVIHTDATPVPQAAFYRLRTP